MSILNTFAASLAPIVRRSAPVVGAAAAGFAKDAAVGTAKVVAANLTVVGTMAAGLFALDVVHRLVDSRRAAVKRAREDRMIVKAARARFGGASAASIVEVLIAA